MEHIRDLLVREPVRLYLYTVAVALIALLVGVGVLTAELAPMILGLVAALLAVPTVERVRAAVFAPKTVDELLETREPDSTQDELPVTLEVREPEHHEGFVVCLKARRLHRGERCRGRRCCRR